VAFLVMDLMSRNRSDLAYVFLNAFIETSEDVEGLQFLDYYLVYRTMVRAKIAFFQQNSDKQKLHIDLALAILRASTERPKVLIVCGLSGSGKSFVANLMVKLLPGILIRSDVVRKSLAGVAKLDSSFVGDRIVLNGGIYTKEFTERVYTEMLRRAKVVAGAGKNCIIDGTFLNDEKRCLFESELSCKTVRCSCEVAVLRERILKRGKTDASEANLAVLDAQLQKPTDLNHAALSLDTTRGVDEEIVGKFLEEIKWVK
jgi:predicted kinase